MEKELLTAMLPEGILEWFDIKKVEKNNRVVRITLEEKSVVPPLPKEHRGKKVVSKGFKRITVDDFPIRGRKGELIFLRRVWEIADSDELLKRKIDICAEGTKLEKEFADFLKDASGDGPMLSYDNCNP
jgi:hypothetical protein